MRYREENIMDYNKTVTGIIEEVKLRMCDDYCRYPREWDDEEQGMELCESEICENCPLNKL